VLGLGNEAAEGGRVQHVHAPQQRNVVGRHQPTRILALLGKGRSQRPEPLVARRGAVHERSVGVIAGRVDGCEEGEVHARRARQVGAACQTTILVLRRCESGIGGT